MADSSHLKILEAVKTATEALSLASIADDDIVIVENLLDSINRAPNNYNAYFTGGGPPGIFLGAFGVERKSQNSNQRDFIGYPVALVFFDLTESGYKIPSTTTALDRRLLWRQKMRERFHNQTLTVTGSDCHCVTEFGEISIGRYLKQNQWVGGGTIYCFRRETRAS